MPNLKNISLAAILGFGLLVTTAIGERAWAQSSAMEVNTQPKIPNFVMRQLKRNPSNFLRNQISQLYRIDPAGIVTKEKYAKYKDYLDLKQRARTLGSFLFMDVNGDFEISSSERDEALRFEASSTKSRFTLLFLEGDKDNDGVISSKELVSYAEAQNNKRRRPIRNGMDLFKHDVNGDGTITPEEVKASVDTMARNN